MTGCCVFCDGPIPPPLMATDRPRRYCSIKCRRRAGAQRYQRRYASLRAAGINWRDAQRLAWGSGPLVWEPRP